MYLKMTFIKQFLLLAILFLLAVTCFYGRLTDTTIIDLTSGFSHPLEGWDHIVTMLGVGIWAAQLRGKAIWLLPTTFVGVMSLGGISGAAKYLAVPSAEILIALSCVVFSILIIRKIRFTTQINVLIVAFFAFFHGYAHGAEISTSASLISYTFGFMFATLLLHGAGILVAKIILLSITFFIAEALNIVIPTELAKNVTASYSQMSEKTVEQLETQFVEKSPAITSPPITHDLPISEPLKTYFVLCAFLLVFRVSQFICYVFYPKQRPVFSKFLIRYFKNLLHFLTLPAFSSSKFFRTTRFLIGMFSCAQNS